MRTISIVNQKGGVGKTTTALNLGSGIAESGRTVLLVDLDPQAHLTYSLGIKADSLEKTVNEVISNKCTPHDAIIDTGVVSLLPSSIKLSGAEIELANKNGRELRLKSALKQISDYDFLIIDCPPNLGLLTLNALSATTEVLVPMLAEFLSIKGLDKLLQLVETVQTRINPQIFVKGILVTMFDNRLKLHMDVYEKLAEFFPDKRMKTTIRRNIALAESASFGKSIFDYAPKSNGAVDYRMACEEILSKGN